MNINPLRDFVIIKPSEAETVTKGGIALPDNVQERPHEGVVVAVGPGIMVDGKLVPTEVKVGDKVLYGKWSGYDLPSSHEGMKIMREQDVYGVLSS